jgi:hypothetical protein
MKFSVYAPAADTVLARFECPDLESAVLQAL